MCFVEKPIEIWSLYYVIFMLRTLSCISVWVCLCNQKIKIQDWYKSFFFYSSITLSGLLSSTDYNITIYSLNGVSSASNQKAQFDSIRVRTEYSLAVIDNLHVVMKHKSGVVVVAWDLASHVKEEVDMYQVKWYPSGLPNQALQNETSHQNYTFHGLDLSNRVYLVQVS